MLIAITSIAFRYKQEMMRLFYGVAVRVIRELRTTLVNIFFMTLKLIINVMMVKVLIVVMFIMVKVVMVLFNYGTRSCICVVIQFRTRTSLTLKVVWAPIEKKRIILNR
jgi:hypothetical protein